MKKSPKIKIAPSILSADFARLGEQVQEAERAGADYIHVDVMDGRFVSQITVGALVVDAIRRWTCLPLDVHLMIENPERQIEQFVKAGANIITVHQEACQHIHRCVQMIKDLGCHSGVSINPATSIGVLDEILPEVDLVLLMTVNPGFAGQTFIKSSLNKITRLRKELDSKRLKTELEVDGGINVNTVLSVVNAGATVLVAGAAVYNSQDNVKEAIRKLRLSLHSPGL
jgi:ribulose-phosphate 3-epimerase